MPETDVSIVSLAGRLVHEWDFAFYKHNGEIANRIREELGSALSTIRVDSDNDIEVKTTEGSFYVTPAGVIAGGLLTDTKELSESGQISEFAGMMESLNKCKGSFKPESYSVRLFWRFTPENGLALLDTHGFDNILRLLLKEKAPSELQTLKFSTRYKKQKFTDLVELEASAKDVQLRYSRDADGADFGSYLAFVQASSVLEMIEDVKSFANILKAAEPEVIPYRGLRDALKQVK